MIRTRKGSFFNGSPFHPEGTKKDGLDGHLFQETSAALNPFSAKVTEEGKPAFF